MKTIILALLFGSLTVSLAHAAGSEAVANFNTLVDRYFDFYFSFYPSDATADGLHQYDSKLEDYSAAARQKEIAGLKDFLGKFEAIKSTNFPADAGADLQWIISSIHSNLLELENVQMWRKDPDHYTAGVTNSIFVIMKRNYAPADQRHSGGHRSGRDGRCDCAAANERDVAAGQVPRRILGLHDRLGP